MSSCSKHVIKRAWKKSMQRAWKESEKAFNCKLTKKLKFSHFYFQEASAIYFQTVSYTNPVKTD